MKTARIIAIITATTCCLSLFASASRAAGTDQTAPPVITVSATGLVNYTPDITRFYLDVREQAPDAASAVNSVNTTAQSVIDAIQKTGVADSNITTYAYQLYYQPTQAQTPPPPGVDITESTQRMAIPGQGSYIATETILVQTSIAKCGSVIDAGISAGANQTRGLSFDTSQRESLYRQALAKAVQQARDEASVLAEAAGVRITGIQSISTGVQQQPFGLGPVPYAASAMMNPPPIQSGTGLVQATVTISYLIR